MSFIDEFNTGKYWGISTHINLYTCNKPMIKDPEILRQWIIDLCDFIHMKRHGEPLIERFGNKAHLEGYSVVQLIETSNIAAHFNDISGDAYIDVFSCAAYDPEEVSEFCADYFYAERWSHTPLLRK